MRLRKPLIILATGALGIGAAGIAYAAWTANGSGSGYAKATEAIALTTVVDSAPAAALYPGASTNLAIIIKNDNPYPVKITSVVRTADPIVTASGDPACNAATGVSFANATGLNLVIPANSQAWNSIAGVTMNNTSDNACQGETFVIPVSLSGASNAS